MTIPGPTIHALEEGSAGGDIRRSADNGVVGHNAKRREKGVHRPAHALIEAVLPTEDFGERPVQRIVDRQIFGVAIGEFFPPPVTALHPCTTP